MKTHITFDVRSNLKNLSLLNLANALKFYKTGVKSIFPKQRIMMTFLDDLPSSMHITPKIRAKTC